jgi:hypothetical protein
MSNILSKSISLWQGIQRLSIFMSICIKVIIKINQPLAGYPKAEYFHKYLCQRYHQNQSAFGRVFKDWVFLPLTSTKCVLKGFQWSINDHTWHLCQRYHQNQSPRLSIFASNLDQMCIEGLSMVYHTWPVMTGYDQLWSVMAIIQTATTVTTTDHSQPWPQPLYDHNRSGCGQIVVILRSHDLTCKH